MKRKILLPWIIIIIALFVFWPIGAYLIYRKITNDRMELLKNSGSLNKAGLIFMVIGFIIFACFSLAGNPDLHTYAKGGVFITSGGVVMFYFGVAINRTAKRYRNYIQIIINDGQKNLGEIAKEMHLGPSKVERDLQSMIALGYFGDTYIDYVNDQIVIKQKEPDNPPESEGLIPVICRNCGGRNSALAKRCQYCDSPLGEQHK